MKLLELSYALTPFLAWLVAGISKFLINCLRERRLAFDLIGYGGLPSNHSAIVTSTATLIGLREGLAQPVFGLAVTLAFIVILDAHSLRRQVGKHARTLNWLASSLPEQQAHEAPVLRERMGHTKVEIASGMIVGMAVAWVIYRCLG